MSEENPIQEKPAAETKRPERRESRSVFAPMVLIAAGIFFLLDNLGMIAGLDWSAALRFWPLLLIFLGLNVLAVQARPPLGTILSLLVSLVAVGTFGYLLLSGSPDNTLRSLGVPAERELQAESFNVTPGAAQTAAVSLHLDNYPTEIAAGDGSDLISGTIWSRAGLDLRPSSDADDHFEVEVGELSGGISFDPRDWLSGNDHTWTFALSPDIPMDLHIDSGNASMAADLTDLQLTGLTLDAGNGSVTADLPEGDYEVRLDGGNGSISLALPAGVEARVEYDEGNGSVDAGDRFDRVSGDNDEGVYETAGYDEGEGILLVVDSGNGSVEITAP